MELGQRLTVVLVMAVVAGAFLLGGWEAVCAVAIGYVLGGLVLGGLVLVLIGASDAAGG